MTLIAQLNLILYYIVDLYILIICNMCIDITFIVLPNKTSNLRSQIRVFEIYYKCIFCHIFYASTPLNSFITKVIYT